MPRFPSIGTDGGFLGATLTWLNSTFATKTYADQAEADAKSYADSIRWDRTTNLLSTVNLDTVTTPGAYSVASGSQPGAPVSGVIGTLEVLKVASAVMQRFVTWGSGNQRVFVRAFSTSLVPYAWVELSGKTAVDSLAGRVATLESSTAQVGRTGMKTVPLTMTCPGTPLSTTTDQGSVRWVRRYAVMPQRVRVHVLNRNTGNALAGGALDLSGVRVGVGDANGGYTNGVLAASGGTIPGDGTELVTPWVTVPGLMDGGYINVTVSWWGGAGTATLQHNQGGGWTTTDDANAAEPDVTTSGAWTRSQTTPLHCWIEAEVPAATPVLCAQGDSITVGTATTDPVGDSWAAVYAYDHGALPVILAMHGSTMTNWTSGAIRWNQYGSFNLKGVVDATVTTLGQNDLAGSGMTLQTLKDRHATFITALREKVAGPVYLGAITPSNKATDLEQMRRDFNTWRATLPYAERGTLDFAAAVDDGADENLDPALTSDGLHPNTAGQSLMADVVLATPVTPYVAPPSKLKALTP